MTNQDNGGMSYTEGMNITREGAEVPEYKTPRHDNILPWISVNDKLPNIEELVIVGHAAIRKDERWVCCGQLNYDNKWYNQWQDSYSDAEIYPTHWMPLPEPPKIESLKNKPI